MELELIRGIWGYHWWGNRKHFDEVAALGEESARKEVGTQFSFPTLKGMLAHIYGVDRTWLDLLPSRLFAQRRHLVEVLAVAPPVIAPDAPDQLQLHEPPPSSGRRRCRLPGRSALRPP